MKNRRASWIVGTGTPTGVAVRSRVAVTYYRNLRDESPNIRAVRVVQPPSLVSVASQIFRIRIVASAFPARHRALDPIQRVEHARRLRGARVVRAAE